MPLFCPRASPNGSNDRLRLGPRLRLQVLPRHRRCSPQLRVLHSGPPKTRCQRHSRYRHPHRALRTTNHGRERRHEALLQPRRAATGRAVPRPAVLCGEHRQNLRRVLYLHAVPVRLACGHHGHRPCALRHGVRVQLVHVLTAHRGAQEPQPACDQPCSHARGRQY
jgi:hypothetical protein